MRTAAATPMRPPRRCCSMPPTTRPTPPRPIPRARPPIGWDGGRSSAPAGPPSGWPAAGSRSGPPSSPGRFLCEDGRVRADRLVAILLLLQARGQVTAAEVAAELEVSERTARRDLEALGTAGVPIYSQQGRNGGWRLAGGGRTDLSGLTASEARALFLVAGPSPMATPPVKAAPRKLGRALPEPLRSGAEAAATPPVVDPTRPGGMSRP